MPGLNIIAGFKGSVDFYYWKGKAVARSWPRSPGKLRSERVQAQWPIFAASTQLWNQLSPVVKQSYRDMSQSTRLTARDLFTRSYINGLSRIYRR